MSKLRAHGLAGRVGRSRRYRLTPEGVRLGALLVKIRTRLLGPLFADPTLVPAPRSDNPSTVEAALRTVDLALDTLCSTLGLSVAARHSRYWSCSARSVCTASCHCWGRDLRSAGRRYRSWDSPACRRAR